MSLDHETETTLLTPIEHAQEALHEGNKQETIHSWESFIEIAREESGHGLTAGQAGELVAEAKEMEPHLLRPANTDINTPLALALISFVFVLFFGLRALGLGYLKQYFNFGQLFIGLGQLVRGRIGAGLSGILMGIINVFIGLVELLSMFTRVISFTLRLFGNMTAGEILLLMATFLIPYLFALPFYGLELLVGFIQALIFSALTLIFLTVAVTSHEEHGEESHK
jgi:F-type H+-transporting ATPase subunit a